MDKIETKRKLLFKIKKKNVRRAKTKRKQKALKKECKRKRNKKLKHTQFRYQRKTEELCSAVQLVEINDMDWSPVKQPSNLPVEISEWHKQEQIAYWKSKAISLEFENRMLKQHLRNVYAQTIIDNASIEEAVEPPVENEKKKNHRKTPVEEVLPNLPTRESKYRLEEMKKIYGDRAEKLISMETGLQLNFERLSDESKPAFWPTLPLKL
ncbi:unnamed protein product [Phyllotreta striolata]|uniref:Uncharacterized protein n=1 Tax=Phyllotreta striolata TaxID=444603 RepID=A0A9N9XHW3_PHYSR|nr:unnamed protein product [Phyllotreta striolata]